MRAGWISAGLVAVTLAVFLQVRHYDFVAYDDPLYVSENSHLAGGLTASGIRWALTTTQTANWHPVTWLSHLLDMELFGLNPGAHHVSSVVLHVLNTLLLFWLLRQMTAATGASGFVAALFAIHPLHVESVAWIAERKDVLATLFWLLTTWAYVGWTRRRSAGRYAAVVVLFALGLMTKPMLVTLPFALLLLDVWPLGRVSLARVSPARSSARLQSGARDVRDARLQSGARDARDARLKSGATYRWWPLVLEKLPLFALAAASSVVTFVVQQQAGAVSPVAALPLSVRVANALTSYLGYLQKTVWPVNLAGFYPLQREVNASQTLVAIVVLAALTFAAVRLARRSPYVFVGWFWFLGTLVPVIGLVQVGVQAMADRYTYVPLIGIFMAGTWGAVNVFARWPRWRRWLPAVAVALLVPLAVRAHAQVQQWKDSTTFWTKATTVAFAVSDYQAHLGIGRVLSDQGRTVEAYEHFAKAAQLKPDSGSAHYVLGITALRLARPDEAIASLTEAVRLAPDLGEAHYGLALALRGRGRLAESIPHYVEALRLQPDSAVTHNDLGSALIEERKVDEARPHFEEALRLKPGFAGAHNNLGMALAIQGKLAEATQHFAEAVRLDPTLEEAQKNLARARAAGRQ